MAGERAAAALAVAVAIAAAQAAAAAAAQAAAAAAQGSCCACSHRNSVRFLKALTDSHSSAASLFATGIKKTVLIFPSDMDLTSDSYKRPVYS